MFLVVDTLRSLDFLKNTIDLRVAQARSNKKKGFIENEISQSIQGMFSLSSFAFI